MNRLLLLLTGLHVDLQLLLQQMQRLLQLLAVQLLQRRRRRMLPTTALAVAARLLSRRAIGAAAERMVSHQLLQLLWRKNMLLQQLLHVGTVLERLLYQQGGVFRALRWRFRCGCQLRGRLCSRTLASMLLL